MTTVSISLPGLEDRAGHDLGRVDIERGLDLPGVRINVHGAPRRLFDELPAPLETDGTFGCKRIECGEATVVVHEPEDLYPDETPEELVDLMRERLDILENALDRGWTHRADDLVEQLDWIVVAMLERVTR